MYARIPAAVRCVPSLTNSPGLCFEALCQSITYAFGNRCGAADSTATSSASQLRGTFGVTKYTCRCGPAISITLSTIRGVIVPFVPRWTSTTWPSVLYAAIPESTSIAEPNWRLFSALIAIPGMFLRSTFAAPCMTESPTAETATGVGASAGFGRVVGGGSGTAASPGTAFGGGGGGAVVVVATAVVDGPTVVLTAVVVVVVGCVTTVRSGASSAARAAAAISSSIFSALDGDRSKTSTPSTVRGTSESPATWTRRRTRPWRANTGRSRHRLIAPLRIGTSTKRYDSSVAASVSTTRSRVRGSQPHARSSSGRVIAKIGKCHR